MTQYQSLINVGKVEGQCSKFSWMDILTTEVFEITLTLYPYQWNIAEQNIDFYEWSFGRVIKRNI